MLGKIKMQDKIKGVSLTELVVAIAILAIIAAVTIPNFRDAFDTVKIKDQVIGVVSIVQFAKSEALKRSSSTDEIYLVVKPGSSWHVGLTNIASGCTTTSTCTIDSGGNTESKFWSNQGCTNCKMNLPSATSVVRYNFRGLIDSSTTSTIIELESPLGKKVKITINKIGDPSICGNAGYPSC